MTRQRYERPTLVRHVMGMMNKLARVQSMQPMSAIEGVPVADLVNKHGSPLFVFSERTLVDRYRDLSESFALRYPRVQPAWSYKTNYLDAVCRVFHREGAWAEVVSEMEYDKARRLGVPGPHIIFNGPFKPEAALAKAFADGARVNLDHFDEIQRAEKVAREAGIRPAVGIRLNMAVAGTPPWSRFGFNLESGQALDAVRRIMAGGALELKGLHSHIGTFIQDVESYREQASKMAGFANDLSREFGIKMDTMDVGGGFASRNTLHSQYLPGEQATPSFAQYAEAVVSGLSELETTPGHEPLLLLETGRALVDDSGYLITTVHANKRLPDGRKALVVDAGVNTLFTAFWYKHDVIPAQEFAGTPEPTVIFGPLCMNIDVVRDHL
ncbi:MAG: diaminopimelate decarboxylase, partial [Deltaproteobacteria bacterium]|nr:diaminopimelate decarboxylase [Deltaproteobacteria bacterium]